MDLLTKFLSSPLKLRSPRVAVSDEQRGDLTQRNAKFSKNQNTAQAGNLRRKIGTVPAARSERGRHDPQSVPVMQCPNAHT
ncbi:hypothetical protein SAMN05216368_1352 [Cryobacterium flavum]|uniref:Uncharacterized protein n=1 Tax=Cryobacterium flavum TaxID=1424659 RepID=A0A5E9G4M1_9MICO|nr:hypothetical protein [Cryobacterium flavum]SDO66357.1 hypothetical protein SAMN05216368_1352 [Cryobacterium flavum]